MSYWRGDGGATTLIMACAAGQPPRIAYWGARLAADADPARVDRLQTRQGAPGVADIPIAESLAMEPGLGLTGPSGFAAHRAGTDWGSRFAVRAVTDRSDAATIMCEDARTRLSLDYAIGIDPDTGVVTIAATLTNTGETALDLADMATAFLPIPRHMSEIIGFHGRWTMEFQTERLPRTAGSYVRENWKGRTSHSSFPALILCTPHTNEIQGEAYSLTLAWSGNHRMRVDTLADGRVLAGGGALFFPGEVRLAPGECWRTPAIVAAYSASGLSALSQLFHAHVRTNILRPETRAKPRPVHYNTWEAIYFNHDVDRLKELADRAAAIGVERFVLDDGWFGARRDDQAGLGDWTVSPDVYPNGLKPVIDHVTGLGMEMGIWFEPEMVNPDSDLYRAHPDWVLGIAGIDQIPFRSQFVLDISRREVADHLFERIDAILSEHPISYIKWDMNRDLNHPGDDRGRPRAAAQISALYALLDRIRAAHPNVEIESCSSGGGRIDYGVLAHTDRVWTSDSNDALDRQSIQRGASYFLPLDVMGSHVGPGRCHQTGRSLGMATRAGTAMMGHMGLELNLLTEPAHDLADLAAAVALYKQYRALLHTGHFHRIDTEAHMNAVGVVATDGSEALYSVAQVNGHIAVLPPVVRLPGLDPLREYTLQLVWPAHNPSVSAPSVIDELTLRGAGSPQSGELLVNVGFQLPLVWPNTVLLLHAKARALL